MRLTIQEKGMSVQSINQKCKRTNAKAFLHCTKNGEIVEILHAGN